MKRYSEKKVEGAIRLLLQDLWNEESEVQAISPPGRYIIWGGKFGKKIGTYWNKCKKYLDLPLKKMEFPKEEK